MNMLPQPAGLLTFCLALFASAFAQGGGMSIYQNVRLEDPETRKDFPARLVPLPAAQKRIHEGMLDVTLEPYHADNSGGKDARQAIQNAIDDAYAANLIVFFPSGIYRCEGGLSCIQPEGPGSLGQRKFAHKLVGSTVGPRPVLRLADNTTIKKPALAKNTEYPFFIRFAWEGGRQSISEDPSRHYCATLRGIHIDMGNNPGVSAVRMHGAQLCVIEDVSISGTSFAYGVDGLPGSGGSVNNLKVTGGKVGIVQSQYRPVPLLTGLELIGQSEYGIRTTIVRGPVVVVGFRIVGPASPSAEYRAVSCKAPHVGGSGLNPSVGNLVMVDGSIEVPGAAGFAIHNDSQDVYLQNVFVKAATIIKSGAASRSANTLAGNADGWKELRRYAFRVGADKGHLVVNGSDKTGGEGDAAIHDFGSATQPPPNLLSQHLWPAPFPSWEDTRRISVTDFGATRDDPSNDDAPAIQAALTAAAKVGGPHHGKTVFIPRGVFHVKSPIQVPAGAKLIGASETISVLEVDPVWKPESATSVLTTADDPTAQVVLAHFAILRNAPTPAGDGYPDMTSQRFLRHITVRSGRTWWRNLQLDQRRGSRAEAVNAEPLVVFTGHAGGRICNLCLDGGTYKGSDPGHHKLLVSGAKMPLSFYSPSVEYLVQPNGQVALNGARDVRMFALKYEGHERFLKATDVDHLQILGGAGNYQQDRATSIISLEGKCDDVRIATVGRQMSKGEAPGLKWLTHGAVALSDDRPIALYAKDGPLLRLFASDRSELLHGDSQNFGALGIGGVPAVRTFAVVNEGFGALKDLAISMEGGSLGDFRLTAPRVPQLAPGAAAKFTVSFSPQAQGGRLASLRIAGNGGADFFEIRLSGAGNP